MSERSSFGKHSRDVFSVVIIQVACLGYFIDSMVVLELVVVQVVVGRAFSVGSDG